MYNKIQDCFEDQKFVVVEHLHEYNVYCIKPVNGDSQEWVLNHRKLQDLQKAHNNDDTPVKKKWAKYPPLIQKLD